MKNIIQPLKGTRDFYPEVMAIRNWLVNTLREVSESFGYQEWEAPFLESINLYAAKSGEELVNEQSFVFPDRSGDLIILRPELTPSLARMIAQRQNQLVFPLRWWSFGPFWRYERPQKGRTREFFQWNVDMIGANSPEADAELVSVIAAFFQKVGLSPSEAVILVNNRKLLDAEIGAAGVPAQDRKVVSRWIDRRDKMGALEWEDYGREIGLSTPQISAINNLLMDKHLWEKSEELVRFFTAVEALGLKDFIQFDPGIVRGLDYYTGTVFEAFEISGNVRRAILGGGRYDNLMSDVGGDPLPAIGFAMGDVVITLILESHGLIPKDIVMPPARVLVTVFDQALQPASLGLAAELRRAGINVLCYPEAVKLPKQFKYADRVGMRLVLVLGPDEVNGNQVTVKDLQKRDQLTISRTEVAEAIKRQLH